MFHQGRAQKCMDKHRRMMEDIYEVPYSEITKEMILDRRELKKTIPYDWRE